MANPTRQELERARGQWSKAFLALNPGLNGPAALNAAPCAADKPKPAQPAPKSPLAVKFEESWARLGGPALTPEWRFAKERRWRFDYAIPEKKIAIELEGGIHKRQGHASPEGYIKDCRKYNLAASRGWLVFRLASGMMSDEDVGLVCAAVKLLTVDFSEEFR